MTSSFESTTHESISRVFEPDRAKRVELDLDSGLATPDEKADLAERAEAAAFESGREQGLATTREHCGPALRALSAAANELNDLQREYLHAQRELIVDLGIAIAEHVVGQSIAAAPEKIIDRIASALVAAERAPDLRVELCPEDQTLVSETDQASSLLEGIQVVANPDLNRGETIVTNGRSLVDARHQTLLDGVREALIPLNVIDDEVGGSAE